MSRLSRLALFFLLGCCPLATAQVKLERKFPEGSTFTAEQTIRFDQKLTIAGMNTETTSDVQTVLKSRIGKRDDAGFLRVEERPLSMQINMNVMGSNYFFDSANPDKAGTSALETLRELHKALARRTTTYVYDKENRIDSVTLDQDVLSNVPEAVRNLAKSQLDPAYLKKAIQQDFDKLPKEPVSKGDAWQRTESTNFGAGQIMTFDIRYTYDGTIEKDGKTLDKIKIEVQKVDFGLQDSPLPLTVKSCQLKPAESSGTILFDRDLGRAVEATNVLHITGDITFVTGGMELPAKLDLKMETNATVKP